MSLDGASPNLFGSVITMQAWLPHSPFEVVFGIRLRMTTCFFHYPIYKKNGESDCDFVTLFCLLSPIFTCHRW